MEHALSCSYGGFPTIRHNEVRNITAHLMSDVCHNVGIEPTIQPITDERLSQHCQHRRWGTCQHQSTGVLGKWKTACIFWCRVFNPLVHTYRSLPLSTCYRLHEQGKKWAYDVQVKEVEYGCFSPLIFSVSGGMGPIDKVVYKKLALMIATIHNQPYSQTVNWLHCGLSFSLPRSSIMCLIGSRSSINHLTNPHLVEAAIDHALCDSRVVSEWIGLWVIWSLNPLLPVFELYSYLNF